MKATERVFRTADGRHVRESHPDAAFLAYPVGHEMPEAVAAELYPPTVESRAEPEPGEKAKAAPANKARKSAANK